jgi:hypothetical protein
MSCSIIECILIYTSLLEVEVEGFMSGDKTDSYVRWVGLIGVCHIESVGLNKV